MFHWRWLFSWEIYPSNILRPLMTSVMFSLSSCQKKPWQLPLVNWLFSFTLSLKDHCLLLRFQSSWLCLQQRSSPFQEVCFSPGPISLARPYTGRYCNCMSFLRFHHKHHPSQAKITLSNYQNWKYKRNFITEMKQEDHSYSYFS